MNKAISAAGGELLEPKVLQICDAIGEFIEYWGFKGVYGRVWALLALSQRPLTQAQIARRLHVSRSLVSMAVAELVNLGLVRAVDASRNAPYIALLDVWPTISDVLRSREWMLVETARVKLEAALEEVEHAEARGQTHPYSVERLKFLLRMTEAAQALLRILIAIRTPKSLASVRSWVGNVRSILQSLAAIN